MTHRWIISPLVGLGIALSVTGTGFAKSDKAVGAGSSGVGKHDKGSAPSASTTATGAAAAIAGALVGAVLSQQDRATIASYFNQHPTPAVSLPPGIAKNVARGKPLPPGIAKRGVPTALSGRLSVPSGYELQTVGADVVLIETGTRIVADVIRDVLRK